MSFWGRESGAGVSSSTPFPVGLECQNRCWERKDQAFGKAKLRVQERRFNAGHNLSPMLQPEDSSNIWPFGETIAVWVTIYLDYLPTSIPEEPERIRHMLWPYSFSIWWDLNNGFRLLTCYPQSAIDQRSIAPEEYRNLYILLADVFQLNSW